MNLLFLDCETDGLIPKGKDWRTDYNDFPNIIQLAWKLNGIEKEFLVYQNGRPVPEEATKIHGTTTDQVNDPSKTKDLGFVLNEFMIDGLRNEYEFSVGYNIYFDSAIIKASVCRYWGPTSKQALAIDVILNKDRRIDVMRRAQKFMDGKWAKLEDLYFRLFGENYKAHSALADVNALERCWNELMKRGIL